jgi:hypothetical protein
MALQSYFDNLEPESPDEEIWRFLPFALFEDLMANDELYFRRADLFKQDETEGIPPEDFIRRVMGLRPWVLDDERQLSHQMGMLAQDREAFYVSCWHQYRHETAEMWRDFAKDGVAIRSRYDLLRNIMDCMLDITHLGVMRYGEERLNQTGRVNVLQFINTKRACFEGEHEVRAIIWCPDLFSGGNRHFDLHSFPHSRPLPENPPHHWVHEFKRRRVDLKKLITGIVVSPWATNDVLEMAESWVKAKNHTCEIRRSTLAIPDVSDGRHSVRSGDGMEK